jgi:hypothetical protein
MQRAWSPHSRYGHSFREILTHTERKTKSILLGNANPELSVFLTWVRGG